MKKRMAVATGLAALGMLSLGACSTESVLDLKAGTCFDVSAEATEVYRVPTVDCSEPHDAEVFYVFDITEVAFYDESAVFEHSFGKCVEAFEGYVGVDYYDQQVLHLDVYPMYPIEEGWTQGERMVVCSIVWIDLAEKLTSSMKGAYAPD